MRNRFSLDDNEKRRILLLHEESTKQHYLNLIVEEEWLSFPGDKNYTYQKQNNKWVAKSKAGKIYDMSKYPSSVQRLEKQFPGGKAPAGTQSTTANTQPNSATTQTTTANTQTTSANTQTNQFSNAVKSVIQQAAGKVGPDGKPITQNNQAVDLKPLIGKKIFSNMDDDASAYNFIIFKATNLNCTREMYEKGMMELQLKRIDDKGNLITKPPYGGKIFYGYTKLPDNPSNFTETYLQRSSENDGWITPDSNPCKNKLDNFGNFKVG